MKFAHAAVNVTKPVEHVNQAQIISGIHLYEWNTKRAKPRGIVLAVHGTTQQAGCFEPLSHYLNEAGFDVVAMDLRGHGKSYFSADMHNFRHQISYSKSADDLARVATSIKAVHPRLPLFCIGESVGAGVTVRAASQHPDLFDGVILASAGTSPHINSLPMVAHDIASGLKNVDRPLDVSEYIRKYSSEDSRTTHEMLNDPLSRTMLSGKELIQTGAFIRRTPRTARSLAPSISVLMLNGADDAIVKPESTEAILNNIPSRDKRMVIIPGCGHLLLGTSYLKKSVVGAVTDWLIYETDSSQTANATQKQFN